MSPPTTTVQSAGAAVQPRAGATPGLLTAQQTQKLLVPRWMILVAAVAGQAVLTTAMVRSPQLGLAQAAFLIGLAGYAVIKRQPLLSIFVLAYLPSAEIVWLSLIHI